MKSNKVFLILFALSTLFITCKDQEQIYDKPRDPVAQILIIEGVTNLVVTDEMETGLYGSVLSWNRANYGKGISVSYTMEVSNDIFFEGEKVTEVIGNDIYMKAISIEQLMEWATETFGEKNPETDKWEPVTLNFRIIAKEVDVVDGKTVISNVAPINVKWYEEEVVIGELKIGFKPVSGDWGEYAVYAWGDAEVYGSWPGQVLEPIKDGWYSFTVPVNRPINLIINNNGNGKQFDFLQNPTSSVCYEFVIGEGNNDCDWTEVNCPDLSDYPSAMYIIGQDFGEWNWESETVVTMNPVNGHEGHFWAVRYIKAGQGFKWCSQKAWSGDFNSLGEDIGFSVSDGNAIVATDGIYMVYIDMPNGKISVEQAKVFGMGDCFGGWNMGNSPFTVDGGKMKITTTGSAELRMYANSDIAPIGGDWWRMEFVILEGNIVYRGNGGDQQRVNVDAGKTITLDFNTETATIE